MDRFDLVRLTTINSGCDILENEPMKLHTTFKIGGDVKLFIKVPNLKALKEILKCCQKENMPFFVLGHGANTLFCDEEYNGVVLTLTDDFKKIEKKSDTEIYCGSGALLSRVCAFAKENSLSGMEALFGIPASIGGATFMNAGAYGSEMKDVIAEVYTVSLSGEEKTFSLSDCNFSYRHSVFMDKNHIITGVKIKLKLGNNEEITTLMNDYMKRRSDKQPLEFPSAGSVFKRPEGYFAGCLIEQCGLKGHTIGGAQVSEKHAGFIINKGSATCEDVLSLVAYIQKEVLDKFGVKLECEIRPIRQE